MIGWSVQRRFYAEPAQNKRNTQLSVKGLKVGMMPFAHVFHFLLSPMRGGKRRPLHVLT